MTNLFPPNAHNIKIVAQDGKVTLKGPVRSEEEKSAIETKATEVAGAGNVVNQLEVAPLSLKSKSQGEEKWQRRRRQCLGFNSSREAAERAADSLVNAGFSPADLSVLCRKNLGNRSIGTEKSTKAPEGATAGEARAQCWVARWGCLRESELWRFLEWDH